MSKAIVFALFFTQASFVLAQTPYFQDTVSRVNDPRDVFFANFKNTSDMEILGQDFYRCFQKGDFKIFANDPRFYKLPNIEYFWYAVQSLVVEAGSAADWETFVSSIDESRLGYKLPR
jgi:hypothetical protein